ncbi:RES family NAD+ phosphorylase [Orrella daihaiensis]|uniref:RES family NAD+ phosphorylase n=1 Tax=Orrella daihaiensis TaxID=2782176 RepID=A0ABY4AN69_9BURK|nr:RES family NAD+ phosphorylase [Orrella daihaiensis]UOD51408.1 RES family NAD+ phosphorylase [Orrella daihaiensis]
MSLITWTPTAVSSEAFDWRGQVWRMVESQYIAATMKLVDTLEEQDLLETLVETSKPGLPDDTQQLDYLLATPFRYYPNRGGSRFRAASDPGVFYGAQTIRTAGAELGYWRWRFLRDATDLDRLDPVAHTAFAAEVNTTVVDLQKAPLADDARYWQHPTDYNATQQFARTVRQAGVGGILYRSVSGPQPSWCLALLTPAGFAKRKPNAQRQTWYLSVSHTEVTLRHDSGAHASMRFAVDDWCA